MQAAKVFCVLKYIIKKPSSLSLSTKHLFAYLFYFKIESAVLGVICLFEQKP